MNSAKWIWFNGDFEIYHSIQLHSRREQYGCDLPPFWTLSQPYPNVIFCREYSASGDDVIRVVTRSRGLVEVDHVRYPVNADIDVKAGSHLIKVYLFAASAFPSCYINSRFLVTDEFWSACHAAGDYLPVGCDAAYSSEDDNPEIFKFAYSRTDVVKSKALPDGMLYDFGKELFGIVHVDGASKDDEYAVIYGESECEAQDYREAVIRETLSGKSEYTLAARAFRYICIKGNRAKDLSVWADYEYLPLEDRAYFSCNRKDVKKIWDICAYTLHLNSREFFLDGIKRDRWCWSGDAYQSYMANNYLFFDPAITKRTIIALLGKPPYVQHINTIADYSMYLIIAAYEYYFATGDKVFIEIYFERFKALYDFINGRLDDAGYLGQKKGDWIFIDWSDMDKDGALCAEQILLWRCRNAMADLSELAGKDGSGYRKSATGLKRNIMKDFWREERGGFVDSYTSGRENITRHANIFAIMYDFVSPSRARKIVRKVLENDAITKITTPYFAFFELNALCKMGRLAAAQRKIESYWGAMVALGATSIWEQYIPERCGIGHYEMYGMKYGCSLCHAWGGGPIYLLGRYCLGVYPTAVGYKTFAVEPNPGIYKSFDGKVPLPDGGEVKVKFTKHSCSVYATQSGGVLILKGKNYPIPADKEIMIEY